jgi:hypothetical protein
LILDLTNQTHIWRVDYSQRYFERIKLMARIDIIDAASDDPIAVFNNDDRATLEIAYTY